MPRHRYQSTGRGSHVADWERTQPPRVWKTQARLLLIVLLSLVTWAALPATLCLTVMLLLDPTPEIKQWALISMVSLVVGLVAGILISSTAKCSLCHSTPFLQNSHRKHQLANDVPLLTYRASAIVHLLLRGRFRCMYCSTPYRIGPRSSKAVQE
ncbi:MAG: hypothetical protein JWM59_549 [Verrucomicrobiales bacterium]|nr:hypothetical protein [Verrucomicrobiales bacterium]